MTLFAIGLILFAIQAGIWARSTAHAQTETDQQNLVAEHNTASEFPAVAGAFLLVVAGIIAAFPRR